jgi:hypothetical protein
MRGITQGMCCRRTVDGTEKITYQSKPTNSPPGSKPRTLKKPKNSQNHQQRKEKNYDKATFVNINYYIHGDCIRERSGTNKISQWNDKN